VKSLMNLGALVLMIATGLLGCRAAKEDYSIASLEKSDSMPEKIETLDQWNSLDPDTKAQIIDSEFARYPNLVVSQWTTISTLNEATQKDLAAKMQTFMGANGATEVTDETYSKVGPVEVRTRFIAMSSSIIGGHIEYVQNGCEMPDESVASFKSKDEAEVSGCELLGASWRSHGLFNYNGAPLEYSDFMEWSH
jgi:hypothetical protein